MNPLRSGAGITRVLRLHKDNSGREIKCLYIPTPAGLSTLGNQFNRQAWSRQSAAQQINSCFRNNIWFWTTVADDLTTDTLAKREHASTSQSHRALSFSLPSLNCDIYSPPGILFSGLDIISVNKVLPKRGEKLSKQTNLLTPFKLSMSRHVSLVANRTISWHN